MAYLDKIKVGNTTYDIQDSNLKSFLSNFEYAIGAAPLEFKTGYYSTAKSGVIGQTATFTGESIRYKCAICPCHAGDSFSVNVYGPSGVIRAYFLCDENMTVVACADGNTYIKGKFVVPDNEDIAYIVFNHDTNRFTDGYYAMKGDLIVEKAEDIDRIIENINALIEDLDEKTDNIDKKAEDNSTIIKRVINAESFPNNITGSNYQVTKGYYSVTSGTTGSDIHYAKTYKLTKLSNKALYVTVGNGYKFAARFWDESNNFIASKNTGYVQDATLFVPEGWTVAFNFENDDVTELDSSDYEAIASSLHIYTENHGLLQTVVEPPVNFNDLKTTGTYRFPFGQSEPNTNQPTNDYGRLIVFNSDDLYTCVQIYVSYKNDVYTRVLTRLDQDTWTAWKNINALIEDLDEKTDNIDKKAEDNSTIIKRVINAESFPNDIIGKNYQITRGYYSTSDGTKGSDIHYAKTYKLTKLSNKALYVTVGNGYKFAARFWDENNNFIASKNTGYVQDATLFVPEGWTVAFNFENDDVTELGSSDYEAIASSLHIYTENHGFLQTVVEPPLNFNDLKTTGTYRFPSGQSEPNTNQPTNDYGRLIVFNSDDLYTCVQIYVSYKNDVYTRVLTRLDQDTWTAWKNINATGATTGLYLHDGEVFRLKSLPDPIPVGENHMGYNDFISSTWETLLPDGYQEGDAYNASTTKIINVNVERESRWTSTAYGANQDTYTIYRYIFTPRYGYKKTILLTSGCHGNEAEGYWSLYRLVRMIYFEGYKYPTLRNLRAVRIIVIPSWNPWGFQHYRRYNAFSALNSGTTDRAKSLQAWRWLYEPTHQVTVDGTLYDISDVGEANVIWETLNEFSGNLSLWLDMHTDPYAGRTTSAGEIDDPRGNTDPYGFYGFTRKNSSVSERMVLIMEDFYNILRNEYNFTEKWHIELLTPDATGDGGYSPWVASLNFPSAVAEISTFMNGFPHASGSAEMMKLAMEYYGNCIANYAGTDGW